MSSSLWPLGAVGEQSSGPPQPSREGFAGQELTAAVRASQRSWACVLSHVLYKPGQALGLCESL